MLFSADETTDVGGDTRDPGERRLRPAGDSEFTGSVRWVQIDIDEAAEDVDHLIAPEERLGRDGPPVARASGAPLEPARRRRCRVAKRSVGRVPCRR